MKLKIWLFLLVLFPQLYAGTGEVKVAVTYVANEGVLISAGEQQVLIDAIHKPYYPSYLPTPPELFSKMLSGTSPFESVDLVLVSHIHRDHFHASSVLEFLQRQPDAILFSTPQVADSIFAEAGGKMVQQRVKIAQYERGVKSTLRYREIGVKLVRIQHGSARHSWIQNAGHIISVGGKTFLHIGDPAFGESDFAKLELPSERIDVAILPVWFLTAATGQKMISEFIKPKHLVAVHISPQAGQEVKEEVHKFYPTAVIFTEPLQEVSF